MALQKNIHVTMALRLDLNSAGLQTPSDALRWLAKRLTYFATDGAAARKVHFVQVAGVGSALTERAVAHLSLRATATTTTAIHDALVYHFTVESFCHLSVSSTRLALLSHVVVANAGTRTNRRRHLQQYVALSSTLQ